MIIFSSACMPSGGVLSGWFNSGNAVFWRSNLFELIREVAQCLSMRFFGFWLKWYSGNVGHSGGGYGVSPQVALCSRMHMQSDASISESDISKQPSQSTLQKVTNKEGE
jgi:hypothetical protein